MRFISISFCLGGPTSPTTGWSHMFFFWGGGFGNLVVPGIEVVEFHVASLSSARYCFSIRMLVLMEGILEKWISDPWLFGVT